MAEVRIEIVGRSYMLACRDGEEPHLQRLGQMVDQKARDAARNMGSLTETRQLLVAALLLADQIVEGAPAPALPSETERALAEAADSAAATIEQLSDQLEKLAERLEDDASNA